MDCGTRIPKRAGNSMKRVGRAGVNGVWHSIEFPQFQSATANPKRER